MAAGGFTIISDSQQTLLPQVPVDVPPERFDSAAALTTQSGDSTSAAAATASSSSPLTKQTSTAKLLKEASKRKVAAVGHKKTQSTAADLFALTMDLKQLHHAELTASKNSLRNSELLDSSELLPRNEGDQLIRNAANLMKRYKRVPSEHSNGAKDEEAAQKPVHGGEDAATPAVSAADRWKKLKTTVHTMDAMKKNDSEPRVMAPENDNKEGGLDNDDDDNNNDNDSDETPTSFQQNSTRGKNRKSLFRAKVAVQTEFKDFEDWLKYQKMGVATYIKITLFGFIIPLSGVAAILYYLVGNPPCGTTSECLKANFNITRNASSLITSEALLSLLDTASTSWWLLFAVRQIITFSMARATESVIVDYLALRSHVCVKILGPFVTLFLVQARGWPIILFCWGITDFIMLFGKNQFAQHWLFYQEYVGLMNARNPSGEVTASGEYRLLLILAVVVSFVVGLKRFFLGFYLGKQTFCKLIGCMFSRLARRNGINNLYCFLFAFKNSSLCG